MTTDATFQENVYLKDDHSIKFCKPPLLGDQLLAKVNAVIRL